MGYYSPTAASSQLSVLSSPAAQHRRHFVMDRRTLNIVSLLQLLMLMACAAYHCAGQPCSDYSVPPTGTFYVYTVSFVLHVRCVT